MQRLSSRTACESLGFVWIVRLSFLPSFLSAVFDLIKRLWLSMCSLLPVAVLGDHHFFRTFEPKITPIDEIRRRETFSLFFCYLAILPFIMGLSFFFLFFGARTLL
jgi:hypothetical protein